MAYTRDQLRTALLAADKAGDDASAQRIAQEIRALDTKPAAGQSPWWGDGGRAQAPRKPAPNPTMGQSLSDSVAAVGGAMFRGAAAFPDMLADAGDAVTRGFTSAASSGLRAVGADDAARFVERGSPGNKQQFRMGQIPDRLGTPRVAAPGMELAANIFGGSVIPIGPPSARANPPRLPVRRPPPAATNNVLQSAERQGIAMMPADVGGTGTRMASGIFSRTLGEIPMAKAAQRSIDSARTAVRRVASGIGDRTDVTGAGQAAQRGARSFIRSSEARAGELYDMIPISPRQQSSLGNTKSILDDLTAGLESNPELSKLVSDPKLASWQKAIAGTVENVPTGLLDEAGNPMVRQVQKGGQLSWQDLKAFRTYVGEKMGAPSLQSDTSQGALKALYAGLSRDMESTAAASGPRALSMFRRANQFYKGRADRIENVLTDVLGNDGDKGSEAAFQQINRWAGAEGGNANKLARVMRSMPDDEASTVRATIVSRLGKSSPGRQNPDGTAFSPAEFATQWNKMSDRAKSTLFPNATHRAALNDIAIATDAMKGASQYANHSNTGLMVMAGGHAMGLVNSPVFTTIMAGGQYGMGVLLSSPRVARIVAQSPRTASPSSIKQTIAALGNVAKKEPGLVASEIGVLQNHLRETFLQAANTKVPMRAAAEPGLTGTVTDTGDYSAY